MSNIHPLAHVSNQAQIHASAIVEAFAVVKSGVVLRPEVVVKSHAYLEGQTLVGRGSVIWPGACIGAAPQDLKYRGAKTDLHIGEYCQIREFVTINSATSEGESVRIGDHCLIMAYCHIAHNCEVGDRVVMSNGATLAGHVQVGDFTVIGGMTAVHQFARIGTGAMVGGMSRVPQDIPPFTIGAGSPYRMGGLNLVGLQRRNIALTTRRALARAFQLTYRAQLPLSKALMFIEQQCESLPEIEQWLEFCRHSKRGLIGLAGTGPRIPKKSAVFTGKPGDQ